MVMQPPAGSLEAFPPKPKAFHMTELVCERGIWSFCLTAEEPIFQFVNRLNCVLPFLNSPFMRRPILRAVVSINPRYDPQEAWNWIYALLEMEAQKVDLDEVWETAIDEAVTAESGPEDEG
jgi:hypothetical protein